MTKHETERLAVVEQKLSDHDRQFEEIKQLVRDANTKLDGFQESMIVYSKGVDSRVDKVNLDLNGVKTEIKVWKAVFGGLWAILASVITYVATRAL